MPGNLSRSTNAAPVWLSDDDGNPLGSTANPLQTSASGGSTSANQTNGQQRTMVVGPTNLISEVRAANEGPPPTNARGMVTVSNCYGFNPFTSTTSFLLVDTAGLYVAANAFWTESTAALAASASFIGTLRSNGGTVGGAGSRFSFFVAEAFSDVAGGTLFIDKTVDGGTTWRQVGSIALVANTSVTLKVPLSAASYRARVVNGTTAQTAALITTAFSLN